MNGAISVKAGDKVIETGTFPRSDCLQISNVPL